MTQKKNNQNYEKGRIAYIEDCPCPDNIKKAWEDFCKSNPMLGLDNKIEELNVVNGFEAKEKLDKILNDENTLPPLKGVICEASIPTLGDSLVVLKYLYDKKNIRLGVVSRSFKTLKYLPLNDKISLPAANIYDSEGLFWMLKEMFSNEI